MAGPYWISGQTGLREPFPHNPSYETRPQRQFVAGAGQRARFRQSSDLYLPSLFECDVSGVALIIGFCSRAHLSLRALTGGVLSIFSLAFLMTLAGCGATVKPQVGPIEFTNAAGVSVPAVTSLAVNGQVYLDGELRQCRASKHRHDRYLLRHRCPSAD
jgi:predicted small lipoprotein YifL